MDPKMDECTAYAAQLHNMRVKDLFSIKPADVTLDQLLSDLLRLFTNEVAVLQGASIMETTHQNAIVWSQTWTDLEKKVNEAADNTFVKFSNDLLLNFGKSTSQSLYHLFNLVLNADIYQDEDFNHASFSSISQVSDEDSLHLKLIDLAKGVVDLFGMENNSSKLCHLIIQLRSALHTLFARVSDYIRTTISTSTKILKSKKEEGEKVKKNQTFSILKENMSILDGVIQVNNAIKGIITNIQSILIDIKLENANDENSSKVLELEKPIESNYTNTFQPALGKIQLVAPVRHIPLAGFTESLQIVRKITDNITSVCNIILNLFGLTLPKFPVITYEQLVIQSLNVSSSGYHLVARSIYASVLHAVAVDLEEYLYNSMASRGIPSEVINLPIIKTKWLPQNPSLAAWEALKSTAVCRARVSSNLQNVLSLWGSVSVEAVYVDDSIKQAIENKEVDLPKYIEAEQWCNSWTVTLTTYFMDLFMKISIENNILDSSEWDYFYWYWDYLLTSQSHAISKLYNSRFNIDTAKYKEKKSKGPEPTMIHPTSEDLLILGKGLLCRGIFRLVIVAKHFSLMKRLTNPYTPINTIFQNRFSIFTDVYNPTLLTFKNFINTLNSDEDHDLDYVKIDNPKQVLQGALTCFQNAKKYFEEARNIPSVLATSSAEYAKITSTTTIDLSKVAISSIISITRLLKFIEENGEDNVNKKLELKINDSFHSQFSVLEFLPKHN